MQRYVEAASGLTALTRERAEKIVKQAMRQGSDVADSASDLVEDLLERSRRNREALMALVKSETQRAIKSFGFASERDVQKLQRQIADLKQRAADAVPTKATKSAAKRSTTKAAGTKKASKKTSASGGKRTSKKSTAKKSSSNS